MNCAASERPVGARRDLDDDIPVVPALSSERYDRRPCEFAENLEDALLMVMVEDLIDLDGPRTLGCLLGHGYDLPSGVAVCCPSGT